MNRIAVVFACALATGFSQPFSRTDSKLAAIFNFEANSKPGEHPAGWGGTSDSTVSADDRIVHSGKWSARIERDARSPNKFSTLTLGFPVDFVGQQITLKGFIRTEEVSESAGLWLSLNRGGRPLAVDEMESRQLKGTTNWTEYSVQLPLSPLVEEISFGFSMAETGKAWVDDIELLVDGKPIAGLPRVDRPKSPLETDKEFENGSGISIQRLTSVQIDNLTRLGRVWGFLKYHHPAITSGKRHWDYDLFRVLPAVLKAENGATANAVMADWAGRLGPIERCKTCATLPGDNLLIRPPVDWIHDEAYCGKALSLLLSEVYQNRPKNDQFYISTAPQIGNPVFENELPYPKMTDAGFRLLGLYRFWNIVEYWFPYRDVSGEDWDQVLTEFVPRVTLAGTPQNQSLEMIALIGRAHDSHANLWGGTGRMRPSPGNCTLPFELRFIGSQAVVAKVSQAETLFRRGDLVEALDGKPVTGLIAEWWPYFPGSNDAARLRDFAADLTRGPCGEAAVRISRDGESLELKAAYAKADMRPVLHDLPGETFRLLSPDVAYLKLSSVKIAECAHYVEMAAGTKGLVIDIRNYPGEFVVYSLGQLLIDKPTEFVMFSSVDLDNPGAIYLWPNAISITPRTPHYAGKVVILVDEISQSQAEYTTMAFRASPNATVVGSTTAGADGNVSAFKLPGGSRTSISGLGIFYPGKRPTQRIGILPDFTVRPTIAGIRAGRDEVLEAGIRVILGEDIPLATIRAMIPVLK